MVGINDLILDENEMEKAAKLLNPSNEHVLWLKENGFKNAIRYYSRDFDIGFECQIKLSLEFITSTNSKNAGKAGKWRAMIRRKRTNRKYNNFQECSTISSYSDTPWEAISGIFEINNEINNEMMKIKGTFKA